jgi:starch synthase
MFSLRYGTIPVVRRTGGLADTVEPFDGAHGTGFVFEHFNAEGLRWALGQALETHRDRPRWERLMRNAMARDFSWERQVPHYVELYERMTGR